MNRFLATGLLTLLLAIDGMPPGEAQARWSDRVRPGQRLRIGFEQRQLPPDGVDTLYLGGTAGYFRVNSFLIKLYEGPRLLGQVQTADARLLTTGFVAPLSLWVPEQSTVIDYSSIRAGIFSGQLVITPHFSAADGYFEIDPRITIGRANGRLSMVSPSQDLLVIGSRIERVPEPATLAASTFAAASIFCLAQRRRSWRDPAMRRRTYAP